MYCPGCGLEELHSNQFCRACGTDLRLVRSAIEKHDGVTASAISARDEIGRAVAAKIRETQSARELTKVAEDVLPQIEKFLESPEEKRLRRLRTGTIISSVGLGVASAFKIMAFLLNDTDLLFLASFGMVTFFIGLSFILNAFFFTIPRKKLPNNFDDAQKQRELDANTNDLVLPESNDIFSSVTEHTTRQLSKTQNTPQD
ncbi:MAG: zinc ribbon domain-containing protein [Acidobacteriota bacterium]